MFNKIPSQGPDLIRPDNRGQDTDDDSCGPSTGTGVEMCEDAITNLFLQSEDGEKLWRQKHRQVEGVEITRMTKLYTKLREGVSKLKVDIAKELGYETGMMGPGGRAEGQY
jgi:hypothetical protein